MSVVFSCRVADCGVACCDSAYACASWLCGTLWRVGKDGPKACGCVLMWHTHARVLVCWCCLRKGQALLTQPAAHACNPQQVSLVSDSCLAWGESVDWGIAEGKHGLQASSSVRPRLSAVLC